MCAELYSKIEKFQAWLLGNQRLLLPGRVCKFDYTVRITTKCRYNAAKRLKVQNALTQITTIVVSLILIFIPLLQLSKVKLYISEDLTTAIQCYFAVVMLVFTLLNSKDNKELRIEKLLNCGSQLRKMSRGLNISRKSDDVDITAYITSLEERFSDDEINKYQNQYEEILQQSENHQDVDHLWAKMDMREHQITGLYFLYTIFMIAFSFLRNNIASLLILASAFIFFLHLIGWINWIQ